MSDKQDSDIELTREGMELALESTGAVLWEWRPGDDLVTLMGEEVFGKPIESVEEALETVHPEDRQQFEDALQTVLRTTEPVSVEYRVQSVDGYRWLESRGKVIEDGPEENEMRVMGVTNDITELKRREQELKRQNERLNKFASIVSHDLRNPLNVVQGRIELAREECDSTHLDSAANAVDRSLELIEDLLTLARGGRQVQEIKPIDLAEIAEDCWESVETEDAVLNIETDRVIVGDPSRTKQLLENLFRNAVEHGGQDVTVTVGSLSDGFYVSDNGPGIPSDKREKVFEEGYSTAGDGTGFGLNIVQAIADALGWKVRITESESGGARFEIKDVEIES